MSTPSPNSAPETREQLEQRTKKVVRRLGYVLLIGSALFIFIPMIVGAAMGIHEDRIWDPYTGERITDTEISCPDEARDLLLEAGHNQRLTRNWERKYRLWIARCRDQHLETFDMLSTARVLMQREGEQIHAPDSELAPDPID